MAAFARISVIPVPHPPARR